MGGVVSQIQDDVEHVVAYYNRALRPSQRCYCTTKREMLAAVAMCIQFRSYRHGAKFTLCTDHKSLVWLHLSRVPASPCRHCTRPDCPPVVESVDQPFDSESTGSSENTDLIPIHSGEDWVVQLDDDLSQPTAISSDSFRISALQKEDPVCITLHSWISSGELPSWIEVKGLIPQLRSLWHHRNNLSVDDNGIIWRKRSTQSPLLSCWYLNPAGNSCSCPTMHLYLEDIWAGTGHWPSWLIASIGRECRMM